MEQLLNHTLKDHHQREVLLLVSYYCLSNTTQSQEQSPRASTNSDQFQVDTKTTSIDQNWSLLCQWTRTTTHSGTIDLYRKLIRDRLQTDSSRQQCTAVKTELSLLLPKVPSLLLHTTIHLACAWLWIEPSMLETPWWLCSPVMGWCQTETDLRWRGPSTTQKRTLVLARRWATWIKHSSRWSLSWSRTT